MKSQCPPYGAAVASNGQSLPPKQGGFNVILIGFSGIHVASGYGESAFLWSGSVSSNEHSFFRFFNYVEGAVGRNVQVYRHNFSVRCKKNN